MWEILKYGKHIWKVFIASNFIAKLGHAWGSFNIAIRFLQSVPKLWHIECRSILSIAHRSASTSVCKVASRLLKLRVPKSWIFSKLSIQIHLHPLNWIVEIHELSIMQILSKLKTSDSSIRCSCGDGGIVLFSLNQAWRSLSAYRTSYKGSMSIPLKILSFRTFHIYQIIQDKDPYLIMVPQWWSFSRKGSPY